MGTGCVLTGVKATGHEADNSLPSSAEVKNVGAMPLLPHMSSGHSASVIKSRDNFTFYPYIHICACVLFLLKNYKRCNAREFPEEF
jgi:hypothetical protein